MYTNVAHCQAKISCAIVQDCEHENKWNLKHLSRTINKIKTKPSNTLRNSTSKTFLWWQMVITSKGVSTTYYAKKLVQGD
jgi:hypothetical protein